MNIKSSDVPLNLNSSQRVSKFMINVIFKLSDNKDGGSDCRDYYLSQSIISNKLVARRPVLVVCYIKTSIYLSIIKDISYTITDLKYSFD